DTHPAGQSSAEPLPVILGYRVLREIARGGMGRVVAAHELALGRDVAVKGLLSWARARGVLRESQNTPRLPPPRIPPRPTPPVPRRFPPWGRWPMARRSWP